MLKIRVLNRSGSFLKRFVPSFSGTAVPQVVSQRLTTRSLIRIAGATAADYLQGLITNDMKHITEGAPCMYAMFLNTKGRLMYDSIIYKMEPSGVFLIECDATIAKDLELHLKKFKVRRKLDIAISEESCVHTVSDLNFASGELNVSSQFSELLKNVKNLKIAVDPRVPALGFRIIAPVNVSVVDELKRNGLETNAVDYYRLLRLKIGVVEGIGELPVASCFPLEANCDYMHGVSFHKGCYIGQELTARTHHTGVVRKRYMPLIFEKEATGLEHDSAIINSDGKSVGKLKAVEKTVGIGLLRIDDALKAHELTVGNISCKTYRPFWWPALAPKERPV